MIRHKWLVLLNLLKFNMRITQISLLFMLSLSSCNFSDSEEELMDVMHQSVTDSEFNAVDSVLSFTGGICKREKGFERLGQERRDYFRLIVESKGFESYNGYLEMPASNVAYLFYSNLSEDDKKKYEDVKVILEMPAGVSDEYTYTTSELDEMNDIETIFNKFHENVINAMYSENIVLFSKDAIFEKTEENLVLDYTNLEERYGNVSRNVLQGFSYFEDKESGRQLIQLASIQVRDSINNQHTITMDRKSREILSYKFDY